MRARLNGQFDEVMALLGDPPDLMRLDEVFWSSSTGLMLADLRPEMERMALAALQTASVSATIPILWDEAVIFMEAAEWAGRYGYDLVRGITDNTRRGVQGAVTRFVETSGETIGQLRSELEPLFGERRAQSIAVTETTRAYAQGSRMVREELARGGLTMDEVWQASNDERMCPICGELSGKPKARGWIVMGVTYDAPPAHVNCRCWTTLRFAE